MDGATALLVPSKDPAALAGAVARLLADGALGARLGASARRVVLDRHTPEGRTTTLSRLYAALIDHAAVGSDQEPVGRTTTAPAFVP